MKKRVIIAVLLCVLVGAAAAIFAFVKNDSEKSSASSSELITDIDTIKEIIEEHLADNGYELGFKVVFGNSSDWIDRSAPNHDIVIVRLQKDHDRSSEIESWDNYFSDVRKSVIECISENNIDKNYVAIDQLE